MEAKHKKHLEELMGTMTCPKGLKCYKSNFKEYCKASDVNEQGFVKCLEANPEKCRFSGPFEDYYICHCPIRVYLSAHFQ